MSHSGSLLGFWGGCFCLCILKITFAVAAFSRQAHSRETSARRRHNKHTAQEGCLRAVVPDSCGRTSCQPWVLLGERCHLLCLQGLAAKTCNEKVMTENSSAERTFTGSFILIWGLWDDSSTLNIMCTSWTIRGLYQFMGTSLPFDKEKKGCDKRGKDWRGKSNNYRDKKSCLALTKSESNMQEEPSGALPANILMALPSLKHINFLSTVTVSNRGNFCSLEYWYFLVATPAPVFHRVQHYSLQIALTPTLNRQDSAWCLLSLERVGRGHVEDHCFICILCTKLKFILAERVSPFPDSAWEAWNSCLFLNFDSFTLHT